MGADEEPGLCPHVQRHSLGSSQFAEAIAKISFFRKVAGLSLRDRWRSSIGPQSRGTQPSSG